LSGIDLLISRALSIEIKSRLEANILKQVEKELFFGNGMSIKLSMEHFEKFHSVLTKFSNLDSKKFEIDCLEKIIQVSKSKNNYEVEIIDKKLSEKIINFYGDQESRKIIQCIMGQPETISEILKKSGVLKSPGYRKIENMLLDGLIFESGKIISKNKRVSKYVCIFDKLNVILKKEDLIIVGVVNSITFNESSIAKIGLFEK